MSDDLVKLARKWDEKQAPFYATGVLIAAMADRIEELEAKVAKARVEGFWAGRSCGESKKAIDTALAKLLKGQDSE